MLSIHLVLLFLVAQSVSDLSGYKCISLTGAAEQGGPPFNCRRAQLRAELRELRRRPGFEAILPIGPQFRTQLRAPTIKRVGGDMM